MEHFRNNACRLVVDELMISCKKLKEKVLYEQKEALG